MPSPPRSPIAASTSPNKRFSTSTIWATPPHPATPFTFWDNPPEPGPELDLADPLRVIETAAGVPHEDHFARPLPPFFAPVGTKDPLLDDTRRLEKALCALGVPCEARYYPGGYHAFHALVWDPSARRCWRDALAFLDRHMR